MKKFTLLKQLALQVTVVTLLSGCITINAPEPTDQSATPTAESQATTEESSGTSGTDYDQDANSEVADQSFDYTISGGCQDSYDEVGYYGMVESLNDDCTLIVQVSPVVPQREVELQFFEDGWIAESTTTTDSEGFAYLDVDPYCDDGLWCEGIWEYRLLVVEKDSLPQDTSITFEIEFFTN